MSKGGIHEEHRTMREDLGSFSHTKRGRQLRKKHLRLRKESSR
jgi:hypothetical protein